MYQPLGLSRSIESPGESGDLQSRLRAGMPALILLAILGALYRDIIPGLISDWWNDANYSHGFLVPLFSGYLAWQKREMLGKLVPQGSWLGFPVLLVGVGMLLLGDIGSEYFLMRSSLIVIISGLILFHLGKKIFRTLAFPLAFLFFMVPLPAILFNAIAFPLQGLAAQNATWALDLLGTPVTRDGNVIHLGNLSLGVTEACSGIRSLISLLALAMVWAHLTLPGAWPMAVLAISAVPITVIANSGRIVLTALIGQGFGLKYAQGFFHTFSGGVIFLVAFACLLGVHGLVQLLILAQRHKEAA